MAGSIDFNKVMEDTKKFFNELPGKLQKFFNDLPQNIKKWSNDFQIWLNDLPNKITRLIEKIKNYPPDKQTAVGAIGLGSILVIVSIFLFIF